MIPILLALLTERQIDSIIAIVGRLIDHIPAVLTMLGTLFLIIRQWINKRDITEKVEAGTKASTAALEVANGHNAKIATAVELSAKVLEKIDAAPQKVEVTNAPDCPVPTTTQP